MNNNKPLAQAAPGVIIEIATPAGNQLLPIAVARELHVALGQALNQVDAQQEIAEIRDTTGQPIPDDPDAQADDDSQAVAS